LTWFLIDIVTFEGLAFATSLLLLTSQGHPLNLPDIVFQIWNFQQMVALYFVLALIWVWVLGDVGFLSKLKHGVSSRRVKSRCLHDESCSSKV
jgi:hypothetical protein